MRDIVIVLAYWRQNYIDRCFECLRDCDGIDSKEVWIFQDDRASLPQNRREAHRITSTKIAASLAHFQEARFIQRAPHEFSRTTDESERHCCSHNSFWALREAYEHGAPFVFFVADDVLVTPDFFKWHKSVQEDSNCFSSVAERAWRERSLYWPDTMPFDLSAYYRADTHLMDGGMCWRRENLGKLLRYPSTEVIDHRFPDLPFDEKCPMIPFVQRAYHVGHLSSFALTEEFAECGDVDSIPQTMPKYEWDKVHRVYRKGEEPCHPK